MAPCLLLRQAIEGRAHAEAQAGGATRPSQSLQISLRLHIQQSTAMTWCCRCRYWPCEHTWQPAGTRAREKK